MMSPEVTRYRPSSEPDKQVRPPPKSFADFNADGRPSTNPDGSKGTFVPPPPAASAEKKAADAELEVTQTQQRLGLLEERIEHLEDVTEELTDAATKPASSNALEIISTFVRLSVVQGMMTHETALTAIAWQLRILDPNKARPALLPAGPPPSAPAAVTRAVAAPSSEPDVLEEVPPRRRGGGRQKLPTIPGQAPRRRAVQQLIEAHSLSQNRIAKTAGLHQSAISRWLRGVDATDETFLTKVEKAVQKLV